MVLAILKLQLSSCKKEFSYKDEKNLVFKNLTLGFFKIIIVYRLKCHVKINIFDV